MTSFVPAHGSWQGGWGWRRVAERLRAGGGLRFLTEKLPSKYRDYGTNNSIRCRSLQCVSRKLARDHQPLDFGRAFPDLINLCVAVPLFNRKVADVAVAAQDLDGVIGHPHSHITCL